MEKDLNTGVEESQAAAENDTGLGDYDGITLPEDEEEVSDEISLDEVLEDEEPGDDKPTVEKTEPEETPTEESADEATQKLAEEYKPVDTSKAFAKRLKEETAKLESKLGGVPIEEAAAIILEHKAQKLVEQSIKDKAPISLEVAKMLVKGQQPAVQQEAQPAVTPEESRQQEVEAWKKSLIDEEPLLRELAQDPNLTVVELAKTDKVFKAALIQGLTPVKAYKVAMALKEQTKEQVAAAKAEGGKELLDKIKGSNDRANKPVSNVKTTGKQMSAAERIANMSDAQFARLNERLANGEVVNLGE